MKNKKHFYKIIGIAIFIFAQSLPSISAESEKPDWYYDFTNYLKNSKFDSIKQGEMCRPKELQNKLKKIDNLESKQKELKLCLDIYPDMVFMITFNPWFSGDKFNSLNPTQKKLRLESYDYLYEKITSIRILHTEMTKDIIKKIDNFTITELDSMDQVQIENLMFPEDIKLNYKKTFQDYEVEYQNNINDIKNGKPSRFGKLFKLREIGKNDVVAQVLNYSSGESEDASGITFFYPIDNKNGKCIYKLAIDKTTSLGAMTAEMIQGLNQLNNLPGVKGTIPTIDLNGNIDLGKVDLNNISFYKINSQNKKTREPILAYQTKIEGLPDYFNCDSNQCNIERIKRGWNLVKEKCKGIQKAF